MAHCGQIVILNGAPRSGKSSIAQVIQETFDGIWINLGVDHSMQMTPPHALPGIGLRPGGERSDLEPIVLLLYRALYETIALHSRLGIHVVVDVGHHDHYATIRSVLPMCARILAGLPVLIVGVRCPLEIIVQRRHATGWAPTESLHAPVPLPVQRWQHAVHTPGIYDSEVDTSILSPEACATVIRDHLAHGHPCSARARLADLP